MLLAKGQIALLGETSQLRVGLRLFQSGVGLLQRRLGLRQRGARLEELLVNFRRGDDRQHLARFYFRTDVDVSPLDVAFGAGIDRRTVQRLDVAGQEQRRRRLTNLGMEDADNRMSDRRVAHGGKGLTVTRDAGNSADRYECNDQCCRSG